MFKILDLSKKEDEDLYKSIIEERDFQSAYNRLEYFKVFCGGTNMLICFLYQEGTKVILLPGYLKQIKIYSSVKNTFDFSSPYGYTGPFFSTDVDEDNLSLFWEEVKNWQLNNNVVSEFIRFNLFNNSKGYNGTIQKTMLNIKGVIISEPDQWSSFEPKVRKNVKRAQRENLISKIYYRKIEQEYINEFYSIYIETMRRTNATDFFFYSLESFNSFILNNSELCAICTIYDDSKPISTELLLISDNSVFSFLGGTLVDAFEKRPNDFLKFEVINWARSMEFKYYVLGGGYGYEDGIFKYKKAFFPDDVIEYNTGRKIVNDDLYLSYVEEVNKAKENSNELDLNDTSFFPLYNKQ
ncbi:GNAT family N-acetyltransferase [Sphingobacterium spiritivorum]|uniref:BioF2-like acetyltransferase domain-containing protein n=1 Tax=Sphingobacterium spiritivorum ATCC 33861 TaxID=525373 RepID=D7VI71_SPHSI|nr:GNAT family N-acetyltransferase [Sphingobacterium spiritivorum]EFK59773.1 hypothetical protein HMPREF0766_10690 [Sphingobacterium spiritivorum ATCC 33861]QQT37582.1 GNAT family N-acetyltransferase [Sphingobacterium spiritivorum]WQD34379.1 GNAT family N-acetyltransferase [Sphingobacterium spiritivorum]SUI97319.1 Uncharacterized protein involved in methicillin resistance [Sphingobacterium spiritivorum]